MNVFQKVTLASLKKNRVRTAVTIVGIMLSVALTTAVTTSVTTLQQYLIDDEVWRSGSWHLSLTNALPSDVDKLEQDSRITQTVSARTVGYADVDTANEYKPYLYILEAGEGMPEMTGIRLISGAMPKDSTELLIPAHLAEVVGEYVAVRQHLLEELGREPSDGQMAEHMDQPVELIEEAKAFLEGLA